MAVADRRGTRRRARPAALWLVLLVAFGVAWMHTLGTAPLPTPDHEAMSRPAVVEAVHGCGAATDGRTCPDDPHGHGHASAMCQSTPPAAAHIAPPRFAVHHAVDGWAGEHGLRPMTAAEDAGDGSGCGPPSLHQLSISRT